MTVRKLTEADLLQSAKCAVQAFGGGVTPDDLKMPDYDLVGSFLDDGTLVSQIEIGEKYCFYGKGRLKCAAIGGVATVPQYRRIGGVRQIYEYVYDRNNYDYDISILYPFSTGYYRKFGYGCAPYGVSVKTAITNLSHIPVSRNVVPADKDTLPQVLELYNRLAKNYSLMFERTDGSSFNLNPFVTTNYTYLWKDDEGIFRGLVSFAFVRNEVRELRVKEILFDGKDALLGILGYLRLYEGALNDIVFEKLPPESPVISCLFNENKLEYGGKLLGMVRIISLENVFKAKIWPDSAGKFTMKINDTIPENNGTFLVEYAGGSCTMTRTDDNPDIIFKADSMSRLLLCGTDRFALPFEENTVVNNLNEDFLRAFPKENTFFVDGF